MIAFLAVALGVAAIIGIHEACHMITAKLFGVKVLKFSLGFGPILLSKQVGDTSYELRLLPLGGFVQFAGDDPDQDVPNGFFSLAWYKRCLIALAGPIANLILGFLILYGILVLGRGWPLGAGFERAGQIGWFVVSTTMKWLFGISTPQVPASHASDLAGPIMVTKILLDSFKEGMVSFSFVLSLISLSLGLFNLFPIMGLDGGHVFLYIIEGIRRKRFSGKVYAVWSYLGFVILFGLMLFTIFLDITKLIK